MGNGIIGKILYFWVFILGGLFFAKILGFANDDRTTLMICIAIGLIYIVFQIARSMGRKKTAAREAANRPPVRKGQGSNKNRHKKR